MMQANVMIKETENGNQYQNVKEVENIERTKLRSLILQCT